MSSDPKPLSCTPTSLTAEEQEKEQEKVRTITKDDDDDDNEDSRMGLIPGSRPYRPAGQRAAGTDPEGGGLHMPAASGQRPSVPPLLAPPLSRHSVCRGRLLRPDGGHAAATPKNCSGHRSCNRRRGDEGRTRRGKVGGSLSYSGPAIHVSRFSLLRFF